MAKVQDHSYIKHQPNECYALFKSEKPWWIS